MEYSFKYAMSQKEFLDFTLYSSWRAPWMKKTRMLTMLRMTIFLFIFITSLVLLFDRKPLGDFFSFGSIFSLVLSVGVGMVVFIFAAPQSILKQAKKISLKPENSHFFEESETTFNDLGINTVDTKTNMQYSWASIVRYSSFEGFFYFYTNSMQGIIVP